MLSERKRSSYRTSCGDDVAFGSDAHINELEDTLERLMSFRNTRKRGTAAKTDVTRALHRVKGDLRTAIRERDKIRDAKKRRSLKEAIAISTQGEDYHDPYCNCEDCYYVRDGHELCADCGSIVGHGCPDSEPCVRSDYMYYDDIDKPRYS